MVRLERIVPGSFERERLVRREVVPEPETAPEAARNLPSVWNAGVAEFVLAQLRR